MRVACLGDTLLAWYVQAVHVTASLTYCMAGPGGRGRATCSDQLSQILWLMGQLDTLLLWQQPHAVMTATA